MKIYLLLTAGVLILVFVACRHLLFTGNYKTPKYVPEVTRKEDIWQSPEIGSEPENNNSNTNESVPPSAQINSQPITSPVPMTIDTNKNYEAILHTDAGDITIILNAKGTPVTVNNFVTLAQKSFYDNTIFHRAIKGFMIQGGDPNGDGTGGPGYKFDDEPFTGEYKRGTVAMANAGPNTNGSQFFIMHADYPLPKNYVIFGQVIRGLETVDAIANAPVTAGASGEKSSPVNPINVNTVEIVEK